MAAYRRVYMIHVICRLTAKNRDQLQNRVWATFLSSSLLPSLPPPLPFLHLFRRETTLTSRYRLDRVRGSDVHRRLKCVLCVSSGTETAHEIAPGFTSRLDAFLRIVNVRCFGGKSGERSGLGTGLIAFSMPQSCLKVSFPTFTPKCT